MAGPAVKPAIVPVPRRRRRKNLAQGTYATSGEKLDHSYFDTQLIVASSTTPMHFFQNAQGQAFNTGSSVKGLQHTNMTIGGQLPRGQRFTIRNIKLMYTATAQLADATIQLWYEFLANTTMEFMITGKDSLCTLTLQEILGASTLILPAVTSTTFSSTINRIILPRFHGIYPLNTPIILAEQTNFEVKVTPQVATPASGLDGDWLKISLNGILERLS
jgi:hypothetical protein